MEDKEPDEFADPLETDPTLSAEDLKKKDQARHLKELEQKMLMSEISGLMDDGSKKGASPKTRKIRRASS